MPQIHEWEGTTESCFHEAKEAGFPEEQLRDSWSKYREKGPRSGTRKAIKAFTKVSRDNFKFTLRNLFGVRLASQI